MDKRPVPVNRQYVKCEDVTLDFLDFYRSKSYDANLANYVELHIIGLMLSVQ